MADYRIENDVAVISMNHPPLNSLSHRTRRNIYDNIRKATRSSVTAIVLCGAGKCFSAGADISEFGSTLAGKFPSLLDVVKEVEECTKPVVSAIHGYALGGGLELAIACHYRIATSNTKVGFPEVNLGILPAAYGTQNFPRLVGLDSAMEWISGGKHYSANEAAKIKAIDRIIPANADVVAEAIFFAKTLFKINLDSRRTSNLPVRGAEQMEEIAAKHLKTIHAKSKGAYAPVVCIEAVKYSATSKFEEGIKKEKELFETLSTSGQSLALRYVFLAEREVQKWVVPGTNISYKTSRPMNVKSGAVIGLGTMGRGIAVNFLVAGIPVTVMEMDQKFLEVGMKSLNSIISNMERHGSITSKNATIMRNSITPTLRYSELKDIDLVIEAVFEDFELKKKIFKRLDKVCKPTAILATNTSALNIDDIAEVTGRPEKVIGMHFFAPANLMRLLENVNGKKTSAETIATCMDIGKRMGKVTVLVGNCYGFVGNRMFFRFLSESDFLLEEGAYPEIVDKALTDYGFAMGRYLVGDLSGNDVGYRIRLYLGLAVKGKVIGMEERERSGLRYCPLSDYLCEKGRYGMKVKKGWYDYNAKNRPEISTEVTEMIDQYRARNFIQPRRIDAVEILERMLYPLINEGFKILDEGYASSPMDIDMVWINGYAWPKHTGGPMFYASTVGLPKLLERMRYYYQKFGQATPHWEPSKMLVRLVEDYGNPPIQQWMKCSFALAKNSVKSSL